MIMVASKAKGSAWREQDWRRPDARSAAQEGQPETGALTR